MKVIQKYQTKNDCYQSNKNKKITPYGIMVHDIACAVEDPLRFVNGWNKSGISKGVHAFIGDESVYECLPCSKGNCIPGWHCAGWLNWKYPYISFEMCESKYIDWYKPYACKTKNQEESDKFMDKVYANAVEYTARKCIEFGWNPLGKNSLGYYYILGHREANAISSKLASGHSDPESVWKVCNNHAKTMNGFRKDVDKKVKELKGTVSASTTKITSTATKTATDKTATEKKAIDVYYSVRVEGGKRYPEVKNCTDFAGVRGRAITDIAIRVPGHKVKYRVHLKGGSWLPYVTGCNWNDSNNGYAGNGKAIDAISAILDGKDEIVYKVSPVNKGYLGWQWDENTDNGLDGYAGIFGNKIDRVQIRIKVK